MIYNPRTREQLLHDNAELESRIAALTVELEQVSKSHTAVNAAWDAARADLATERAARERAESDRDQAIADEKSEIALRTEQEALVSRLIVEKRQAERERDAALARVKTLELWKERHKVDPAHVEALEARVKELEAECELKGQLASARELQSPETGYQKKKRQRLRRCLK